MRKVICIGIICVALTLPLFARAQFGRSAGPKFYSEFKPVVGGWSEYQTTGKGAQPTKMKIAVVGKEGDAYWYESVMEGGKEGRMISKMLVSGDPGGTKNVKRIIVKVGNEPAMEMPVQMMGQRDQAEEPKGKLVDKGTETVKVPAGTFTAKHMQYQDGDMIVDTWVQKDISPYGMVKSQSKDMEMVLIGYGTGATTLITETPQKFEMPQMPEGRPRRK